MKLFSSFAGQTDGQADMPTKDHCKCDKKYHTICRLLYFRCTNATDPGLRGYGKKDVAHKINEKCHFNVVWIFSLVSFTFWLHFNCNLPLQQLPLPPSLALPQPLSAAAAAVVVRHACIFLLPPLLFLLHLPLHTHVKSIHLHPKNKERKKTERTNLKPLPFSVFYPAFFLVFRWRCNFSDILF